MQLHGNLGMTIAPKNRKGRKRKSGRRQPDGRIAPHRPADYRAMAALNPDRRGLAEGLRTHERAGSVLGRLNLKKRISEHEYEAGCRYSVIVGAYRAMIGVPAQLGGNGRGFDCDPFICMAAAALKVKDVCTCNGRRQRYDDAYCSIRTHAAHLAVNAAAIHDHDISPDQLGALREGLAALARHFGLTGRMRQNAKTT
jgi:hypothetical protein